MSSNLGVENYKKFYAAMSDAWELQRVETVFANKQAQLIILYNTYKIRTSKMRRRVN